MITLPTEKSPAAIGDPRFLVIYGREKSGKSSMTAQLPRNLNVDLEILPGHKFLDSMSVHTPEIGRLLELLASLKDDLAKTGAKKYKYITLDNGTELERIAKTYATWKYQQLPIGKRFTGDLFTLPNGSGYYYFREAVLDIITDFQKYCETLILICHTNSSQINIEGQEQTEMSMQMTGKLREMIGGRCDAIGFLYRDKNKNILNMKTDGNMIHEARPEHLRGKRIELAESDENGKITVDWKKVFIELEDEIK